MCMASWHLASGEIVSDHSASSVTTSTWRIYADKDNPVPSAMKVPLNRYMFTVIYFNMIYYGFDALIYILRFQKKGTFIKTE